MRHTVPWLFRALIVTAVLCPVAGSFRWVIFSRSQYLVWNQFTCRREHREPLAWTGWTAFIPSFP